MRLLTDGEIKASRDSQKQYAFYDQDKAIAKAKDAKTLKAVFDLLKKHGVTITSEGVEVPYSDEWNYIEGYDRKTLIKCDVETQLDCEELLGEMPE